MSASWSRLGPWPGPRRRRRPPRTSGARRSPPRVCADARGRALAPRHVHGLELRDDRLGTISSPGARAPPTGSTTLLPGMFDTLTGRLNTVFKKLKTRGKLHPKQVDQALEGMRSALLE